MKTGLLCSGNLGEKALKYLYAKYELIFVFTDKNSNHIVSLCSAFNIPVYIGNPRNENSLDFIKDRNIDILISINYLFIINKDLINFPKLISFNIHGSLLPKYRGRTPHVWSIINNEKFAGVTVHLIDEGCDSGDIIEQVQIPIGINDTGYDLLKKYEIIYLSLLENTLNNIKLNNITLTEQDQNLVTYFGKRTPEDGEINWDWQKERIRNWVRAQSFPYPGAFTYFFNKKIVIDRIEYSDFGFNSELPNGTIISEFPLTVKTTNGAIKLISIRDETTPLKINDRLSHKS